MMPVARENADVVNKSTFFWLELAVKCMIVANYFDIH